MKKDTIWKIFIILFFAAILPLYIFNLGGTSLADFDEAWYAEIARNILKFKDPLLLVFNGNPYYDHPPLGFQLMAISYLIFGINEFSARLPSALSGFGSVVLLYLLGKNLFNKMVGFGAAALLTSSVWFILRSRSGNLDAPLVFFFILTLYLAVKTIKAYPRYILLVSISLAALLMVKSFIGITIILPITFYFLLNRKRITSGYLLFSVVLFIAAISPWLISNYSLYGQTFFSEVITHRYEDGKQ